MTTTTISPLVFQKHDVDERELVQVTNTGDREIAPMYESKSYVIPPGETRAMPYSCAVLWFGDPRSRDHGLDRNDRTREFLRLKFKYGVHTNPVDADSFPTVTVTDYDGNHIPTVLEDPEGELLTGNTSPDEVTPAQLQAMLAKLQAQVEAQGVTAAPSAPVTEGVERPDGTVAQKKGPKRDGS